MRVILGVAAAVLLTPGSGPAAENPSAELRRVADVARSGWAALQKCMPALQVDYEVRSYAGGRGTALTFHAEHSWRTRESDRYVTVSRHLPAAPGGKASQDDVVFGGNPSYQFDLKRPPGASEWRLSDAVRAPDSDTSGGAKYSSAAGVRDIARPWSHYRTPDGQLLHELFSGDSFVADGVSPSPVNPAWIRVQGTRPQKAGPNGRTAPKLVGWFDIDPGMGGCCRGMDVKRVFTSHAVGERHTHAVQLDKCGAVVLTKDEVTATSETGGQVKDEGYGEWLFRYSADEGVPEEEFTLTAFGLPEPYFAPAQRSYLWLYLAVGAAVAAVGGWLVRRRLSRRGA